MARAAIVTTLRDAGPMLDSFIAWHLESGFERLYLFFDDSADPDLARLAGRRGITMIAHDAALREAWRALPEYARNRDFLDREVMARQELNTALAIELARRDGLDWLLHIDVDELFFTPDITVQEHFAAADAGSWDTIRYLNFEAVPEKEDITDPFREVDLFRIAPALGPGPHTPEGRRLLLETPQMPHELFFHFYSNGKSAMRLSSGLRPQGVHRFAPPQGTADALQSDSGIVLHYPCCGFENFWKKYAALGRFSDRWFGRDDIRAAIGSLHLDARDIVATGDVDRARAFYRERVALTDRVRAQALIEHQALIRFPQVRQRLR